MVAGLASLVVAGCGGSSGRDHASTPTPRVGATGAVAPLDPLQSCRTAARGWHALVTSGVNGASARQLGPGPVGIVFLDDSNDQPCAWVPTARFLSGRGYAVAVFQAGAGEEAAQAVTLARAMRRGGARRIVLIGASVGARSALQAAARHPPGVIGVVALSAERRVRSNPRDLLPIGRRIRVPVLTIGSRDDGYTVFGHDTIAWHRTIPNDKLLMLSGGDHGVDLLANRHKTTVRAAILRFLHGVAS
jgi:pimeloyl-ACP methyl ester carboxylesterase